MLAFNWISSIEYIIPLGGVLAIIVSAILVSVSSAIAIAVLVFKYKKANAERIETDVKSRENIEACEKECEKNLASLENLRVQFEESKKALVEARAELSVATKNNDELEEKNNKLNFEGENLKKSIAKNNKIAKTLSQSLREANGLLEELQLEIDKYEAERRPADSDFEMRWREYDCLSLLHNILSDASMATSADYMKAAIDKAMIEIRKIVV